MFRPVLIAATVLTLGSACTATPTSPPPSASPVVTATATSAPTTSAPPALPYAYDSRDVSGYTLVCSKKAFPGAAAYAGKAPHPIAFFGFGEVADWDSGLFVSDDDSPVDKWYAGYTVDLQLAACVNAKRGRQLRDCGTYFGTKSVHVLLYRGEYTIDVYETRTAKPVARGVHLSGENATKCPVVLSHKNPDKTGTVRIITDLSGKQVSAALRRYVLN